MHSTRPAVAIRKTWRSGLGLTGAAAIWTVAAACAVLCAAEPAAAPFRWTQMERHPENPILSVRPGTWESQWLIVDTVLKLDGRWWMYYDGADPLDKKTTALGLAYSDDGVHWTRREDNPIWCKFSSPKDSGSAVQAGAETFNIYYSGGVAPEKTYAGIGLIRARLTRTALTGP